MEERCLLLLCLVQCVSAQDATSAVGASILPPPNPAATSIAPTTVAPPSESMLPVAPPSGTTLPVAPPSGTTLPVAPPSGTTLPVAPPSGTTLPVVPPSGTTLPVAPPSGTTLPVAPPSGAPPSGTTLPVAPPSGDLPSEATPLPTKAQPTSAAPATLAPTDRSPAPSAGEEEPQQAITATVSKPEEKPAPTTPKMEEQSAPVRVTTGSAPRDPALTETHRPAVTTTVTTAAATEQNEAVTERDDHKHTKEYAAGTTASLSVRPGPDQHRPGADPDQPPIASTLPPTGTAAVTQGRPSPGTTGKTEDHTENQTRDQTRDQTGDQTGDQTKDQTGDQTGVQTGDQGQDHTTAAGALTTAVTTATAAQVQTFSYWLNRGLQTEEEKDLVSLCRQLMGSLEDGNCTLTFRRQNWNFQLESAEITGKVKLVLVKQQFEDIRKKPTDNRTLITILASCGALLIMIIILAVCASQHRKPYGENQQHLTEELQTVENGYHDNPTLEVMEAQGAEPEKKALSLNGEFNDNWIVPIENLLDEEDTHL